MGATSRANNIAVVLKKVRLSDGDIVDAILRGNAVTLNEAAIEALLSVLPTEYEVRLVSYHLKAEAKADGWGGQATLDDKCKLALIAQLADVDRFILAVGNLSGLLEKLRYMQLQLLFTVQVRVTGWHYSIAAHCCWKPIAEHEPHRSGTSRAS